ncbi:MAG: hypothetical protein WD042_17975 [Phycisphaeraceae bacterium]
MRMLKYLNTVLTLIALLLTLNLWTLWTAAPLATVSDAQAAGLPDAGAQRQELIDQLKSLNKKVDETNGLFKSGQARVKLENAGGDDK